jgi:hypothetical protein
MRRATRPDGNQGPIVSALEKVGAFVVDMTRTGGGFPDLVVGFRSVVYLLEVKNPDVPKRDQRLKDTQEKLHGELSAVGVTVHIVLTADDALRAIGAVR